MTATEIELRAEVLGLRGLVAQLDKQAKENRDLADHIRNSFIAALDGADISEDTRHRIMLNAAAELLMTAAAMGDDDRPGPPTEAVK